MKANVLRKEHQHLRLIKGAEKRLLKRQPKIISNADQIRYLTVTALRAIKTPLSLYSIARSFRDVLQFKVRTEYLLMELLLKTDQTGIVLMDNLHIGLKEWKEKKQ